MDKHTLQANGLQFNAGLAGDGPDLLFLGGSNADLRRNRSPLTSRLTEHFRVLSFDQRGLGQSDKPDTPYTMQDYAEDAAAVLDAVGWQRTHVVGYSFGGMVAQELAIRFPDRVNRLVLAATTAGGEGGSSYPIESLAGLTDEDKARRSLEVSDLRFTATWQAKNPEEAKRRIHRKMRAQSAFSETPGTSTGKQRQLAARAQHNTFDRLHQIMSETLVIAGEHDGQAHAGASRSMADRIPDNRFTTVDGSHAFIWESDTAFQHIERFLASH